MDQTRQNPIVLDILVTVLQESSVVFSTLSIILCFNKNICRHNVCRSILHHAHNSHNRLQRNVMQQYLSGQMNHRCLLLAHNVIHSRPVSC